MAWGEPTMVQAEKMLFAAALEDPANQRFVLLSDRYVLVFFGGSDLVPLVRIINVVVTSDRLNN